MFEAAELGHALKKSEYKKREPDLHTELLQVQRRLRESASNVLIIISGVEGAGKGAVVSRLNAWLDTRSIRTEAYWTESDEERERPWMWRFWRNMPPRGELGIMFGSWYTQPIVDRAYKRIDEQVFQQRLARIAELERMLRADGTIIVKFWFHLSQQAQQKLLAGEQGKNSQVSPYTRKFAKHYKRFRSISARALRATDTAQARWTVVEAHDTRYRDIKVGETLLSTLRTHLDAIDPATAHREPAPPPLAISAPSVLDTVDLSATLSPEAYGRKLDRDQRRLRQLAWKLHKKGRNVVAVFEGWDAAGKGGAIRRVTAGIDARLFRVISIAAPTDEERARHYLWRFWRHIPRAGQFTIYDRSWYGRVLVERVEGFAQPEQWQRAYQEINAFEEQLTNHGTAVLKFWVHISPEEQLARFQERERTPWKMHKITEEDWRNRDRWNDYGAAVNEMVVRTSTENAPWTLIAGNDKLYARLQVLRTFRKRLESLLE